MNISKVEEAETDVNYPQKQFQLSPNTHSFNNGQSHSLTGKQSVTQQQLYSRGIVREVMRTRILDKHKDQHKTIKHDIHRIPHGTPLYATPKLPLAEQLRFDSIPPRDKLYSSLCSAKIRHISTAMQSKLKPSHSHKVSKNNNQGEASAQAVRDPNISVSGLVTYKFSSVTAERSLGLQQIDRLQDMQTELSSLRRKRECARAREKAILSRRPSRKRARVLQTDQAIMDDTRGSTEEYLGQLVQNQEDNTFLYNQRASKLRFIKELMQEDSLPYEHAHHIVQKIQEIHASPPQVRRKHSEAAVDEEEEFAKRRVSVRKSRVMVRYQTFID